MSASESSDRNAMPKLYDPKPCSYSFPTESDPMAGTLTGIHSHHLSISYTLNVSGENAAVGTLKVVPVELRSNVPPPPASEAIGAPPPPRDLAADSGSNLWLVPFEEANSGVGDVRTPVTEGGGGEKRGRKRKPESARSEFWSQRPEWLPEGWLSEVKVRTSGATAGTRDRYYYDPGSGHRFRSKKEVLKFLETGVVTKYKPKPKNEESNAIQTPSHGCGPPKISKTIDELKSDFVNPALKSSHSCGPPKISKTIDELKSDFVNPALKSSHSCGPPKISKAIDELKSDFVNPALKNVSWADRDLWMPYMGNGELPESSTARKLNYFNFEKEDGAERIQLSEVQDGAKRFQEREIEGPKVEQQSVHLDLAKLNSFLNLETGKEGVNRCQQSEREKEPKEVQKSEPEKKTIITENAEETKTMQLSETEKEAGVQQSETEKKAKRIKKPAQKPSSKGQKRAPKVDDRSFLQTLGRELCKKAILVNSKAGAANHSQNQ